MPKKPKRLTREGQPTQRPKTGLEIPVPTRDEFFGGLTKAARDKQVESEPTTQPAPKRASRSDREKS